MVYEAKYFFVSALRNIRESKITSAFTALTLGVALGFLGAYLAVFLNLKDTLGKVNERIPLTVYLEDNASAAMADAVRAKLGSDPSVAGCDFVSKEQALKDFRGASGGEAPLIESIGYNPLPASFEVRLRAGAAPDSIEALVGGLRDMPGVEEVQYFREEARKLQSIFRSFSVGGAALGMFVLAGVVFISYSTLRLAVLGHRDEIEMLKLMGSSRIFLMGPFLFEGVILGLTAALVSLGLLYGVLQFLMSDPNPLVPAGTVAFLPVWACALLLVAGGLTGLAGSFFAFFRMLRY